MEYHKRNFSEQGLPLRGHWDYSEFDVTREKRTDKKTRRGHSHAVLNLFAVLDSTFRNHLKHGSKNSKIILWKIQNKIIECLVTFFRLKIEAEMFDHFALIVEKVTDSLSNSEVLLLGLRYVTFLNKKPEIWETFFDLLHI